MGRTCGDSRSSRISCAVPGRPLDGGRDDVRVMVWQQTTQDSSGLDFRQMIGQPKTRGVIGFDISCGLPRLPGCADVRASERNLQLGGEKRRHFVNHLHVAGKKKELANAALLGLLDEPKCIAGDKRGDGAHQKIAERMAGSLLVGQSWKRRQANGAANR